MALKSETILGVNRIFLVLIYTNRRIKTYIAAKFFVIFVPKL